VPDYHCSADHSAGAGPDYRGANYDGNDHSSRAGPDYGSADHQGTDHCRTDADPVSWTCPHPAPYASTVPWRAEL
jgi:hypothetical protein